MRNYSNKEYVLRIFWWFIYPFFRYSPRHLYGWRNIILKLFGSKIGKNVKIYPSCKVTFPWKLIIKNNVTISWDVIIYNLGIIEIGNNVVVSQHTHLCAGTHDYISPTFDLIKCNITIQDNVWIAADVFIGPNVIVSRCNVIGARAALFQSTTPNSLYTGNPASLKKEILK